MKNRKCKWCEAEDIVVDKENSMGAVYYKKSYYHKECFDAFCAKKMSAKKPTIDWSAVLNNTPKWQSDARTMMREASFQDDLYHFLLDSYNLSCISGRTWKDFASIREGKYPRLAYAIGSEELLSEWQFYMEQLREIRRFKTMTNDQALIYDLAVILGKNAEYRELMAKKKVEEQIREAQKSMDAEIDANAMTLMHRNNGRQQIANRRAELFKEVMGDGN